MNLDFKNTAFIRLPKVEELTGLSKSTIWRLEQLKQFPKRRKLSAKAVGWALNEIQNWLDSRI